MLRHISDDFPTGRKMPWTANIPLRIYAANRYPSMRFGLQLGLNKASKKHLWKVHVRVTDKAKVRVGVRVKVETRIRMD